MSDVPPMHTILIVDDTPVNIDLLTTILKDNYHVRVANSGRATLKIVAKSIPDLILLDVAMPEMDGYEVCRRLKSDPSTAKIPIIFVTGNEPDKTKEEKFGAVGTIRKPVNIVTLEAMISRCFQSRD